MCLSLAPLWGQAPDLGQSVKGKASPANSSIRRGADFTSQLSATKQDPTMQQEATLAVRWAWAFDEPDAVTWRAKFTDPPLPDPFRPLLSHSSPMSANATLKAILEPGAVGTPTAVSRFPRVGYWRVKLKVTATWLNGTVEVATASDSVIINVTVTEQTSSVDLEISNGQRGQALGEDAEEIPGAFTVANLNDTDSNQAPDRFNDSVPGEQDLMQLIIHQPTGAEEADLVTLTIGSRTQLWTSATKGTAVNNLVFAARDLPKTLWVEARFGSTSLRDMKLTMTCNGATDTVNATAIWVEHSGWRNSNPPTILTVASPAGGTTITVAGGTFVAGDHIIIFSAPGATPQYPPEGYNVVSVAGSVLTITPGLRGAWATGSEVRQGMSAEIDNKDMIKTFVIGGGKLGSAHVTPRANNAMEMQFTVGPPGIGNEPGIIFDISRQKESICWRQEFNGTWLENPVMMGKDGFTPVFPSNFPARDEVPNDDGPNDDGETGEQVDEDNTPTNDHIYSRDMPGRGDDSAPFQGYDMRFNMFEFVRVKLDGGDFDNNNGQVEGSRCSAKVPWQSRMELLLDPTTKVTTGDETTYKWMRGAPAKNMINIVTKHTSLIPR